MKDKANYSCDPNTTVAAAGAAAVSQPDRPAAPGLARCWTGRLGRRCSRCCCYCGILFIAVVFLFLYIIYLSDFNDHSTFIICF